MHKKMIHDITTNLGKCFYYFQKFNLSIKSQVIDFKIEGEEIVIIFHCGHLSLWKKSDVEKVRCPSNIISDFEWCYAIKNVYGDFIGYIGKNIE